MNPADHWSSIDWSTHAHEVLVHGRTMRYVDRGAGPVVVLVHGMAGSWKTWLPNLPAISDEYRVIAVDLPGFGGSAPLLPHADFSAYAAMLEGLLDVLEISGVAVVGHSLGGLVTLSLAERIPERVRCVVLVSGGGAELSRSRLAAIQGAFAFFRVVQSVPGVTSLISRTVLGRLVLAPAVHRWRSLDPSLVREMIPTSITSGFMDAIRLGGRGLKTIRLERVAAPALLVWGRRDRILPLEVGNKLQLALETSDLVVIEGVGHCAMLEEPERFDELVLEFLDDQRSDKQPSLDRVATARNWFRLPARRGRARIEGLANESESSQAL